MKRGEIWTLQDDQYATKARPVVLLQSELADEFESVVLALLSSFERKSSPARVLIEPAQSNGLMKTSYVMTEKLLTVPRIDLGIRVRCLTEEQMHAISRALVGVLGIEAEDVQQLD